MVCGERIRIGAKIIYHLQARRFVHEDCGSVPCPEAEITAPYSPPTPRPQASFSGVDILGPDSPINSLTPAYRKEAVRWIQFHSSDRLIPGIHVPFITSDVIDYLRARSRTTKALNAILTKLKKMGELCSQELHTSKHQQPSIQYKQLRSAVSSLLRDRRNAGLDRTSNAALAVGNFAISLLLAALRCGHYPNFMSLHQLHRECLTILAMQHSGCMRFGIFRCTTIKRCDLSYASQDASFVLSTNWSKYHSTSRSYTIRFPCQPDHLNPDNYHVMIGPQGVYDVSAGDIISWYVRSLGDDYPPYAPLFPALEAFADKRGTYQQWLQRMFTLALPEGSAIPSLIRPHSARAGWATDRSRLETPVHTILAEGRWSDQRAMRGYIRSNVRDLSANADYRLISIEVRARYPLRDRRRRR